MKITESKFLFVAQGLPPLPDEASPEAKDATEKKEDTSSRKQKSDEKETKVKSTSLSFSSSGAASSESLRGSAKKRKAVGDGLDGLLAKENAEKKQKQKSRAKKAKTGVLLSFTDDDR